MTVRPTADGDVESFHFAYVMPRVTSSDDVGGPRSPATGRLDELVVEQAFATDDLRGYLVRIVAGTGAGQVRLIALQQRQHARRPGGLGRPAGRHEPST